MEKTISVRDTFVRKPTKENFYHGILLGILGFKAGWSVTSNQEAGDGYCDILVRIDDEDIAILIEVKYAENSLESESLKGMKQINETRYIESLRYAEIHTVLKYAIACRKKACRVAMEVEKL